MKKFNTLLIVFAFAFGMFTTQTQAQIYEPEGINMPGFWNGWINPPTNNLAFASEGQSSGQVSKQTTSLGNFYQTILECSATGDLASGSFDFKFSSGPLSNIWQNEWTNASFTINQSTSLIFNGGVNNNVTLQNNKWYIVNLMDNGYTNTDAIFIELSGEPVNISTVSVPSDPIPSESYEITITVSGTPSVEETFMLAYTTNNWTSSNTVAFSMTGTTGTASIPGQDVDTEVKYYVYSTLAAGKPVVSALYTISYNNNSGSDFSYTIGTPPDPSTIDWCNLQWPPNGSIASGESYNVYGQVYKSGVTEAPGQGIDLQAWVGYNFYDTDPSTWTNWVPCTFNTESGNNDEFVADLGVNIIGDVGTAYYAMRYQYMDEAYVYGGYSSGGGGFWNGTTNVSGTLDITPVIPLSNWSFAIIGFLLLSFVLIKFRK